MWNRKTRLRNIFQYIIIKIIQKSSSSKSSSSALVDQFKMFNARLSPNSYLRTICANVEQKVKLTIRYRLLLTTTPRTYLLKCAARDHSGISAVWLWLLLLMIMAHPSARTPRDKLHAQWCLAHRAFKILCVGCKICLTHFLPCTTAYPTHHWLSLLQIHQGFWLSRSHPYDKPSKSKVTTHNYKNHPDHLPHQGRLARMTILQSRPSMWHGA